MKIYKTTNYNRIYIRFFLILLLSSLCVFCSGNAERDTENRFKIGIIFGEGGKDDMSFNANAWQGAMRAKNDFNIEVKDVETGNPSMIEPTVRIFAEQDFNLIIGVGFAIKSAIEKIAPEFPDKNFVTIDTQVDQPNVASLIFQENESSYLVGIIAGMMTKTGVVGFVGGMKMPIIERAYRAYTAGVKYADPGVRVLEHYAGVTINAFSDPAKGKELTLDQISRGADIVYQAAGATGMGVFDAAVEQKIFAIGSDSNQNRLRPGVILTSMLKKLDVALYEIIRETVQDSFEPGIHIFNLTNDGVGYAIDEHNQDMIPNEVIQKVEEAKQAIISGAIKVPDHK
ncbi:MAG: BMP family ABC transporter substrate-binding protein [bacterium]|nr:BMP family ABC transporter substrate-binding protein [bacterium]